MGYIGIVERGLGEEGGVIIRERGFRGGTEVWGENNKLGLGVY